MPCGPLPFSVFHIALQTRKSCFVNNADDAFSRHRREIRPQLEQSLNGFTSRIAFSQLSVDGGHRRLHTPVARQIAFEQEIERTAVIALAIGVVEVGIPIPSGVIGI